MKRCALYTLHKKILHYEALFHETESNTKQTDNFQEEKKLSQNMVSLALGTIILRHETRKSLNDSEVNARLKPNKFLPLAPT